MTASVVSLADHSSRWWTVEPECCLCGAAWVAVVPNDPYTSERLLQCPECMQMSGQVFFQWCNEDGSVKAWPCPPGLRLRTPS